MAAGMILLHPLWTVTTSHVGSESVLRSVEVDTLVMATTMSIPMIAWMRFRGHAWTPAWEMSAAMYAGFVVLFPALWAGALDEAGVETHGHALMFLFMLLAMLWRRHEYANGHHLHHHHAQDGAASESMPTSAVSRLRRNSRG